MDSHSNIRDDKNLDRVQELTWALVDEQISDDEFEQLNSVLLRDDKSRDTYLGCIQLHADLMAHFAAPSDRTGQRAGTAPILGLDMPLGFQSPSNEEAAS
jgi:hypothetical protein